MRLLGAFLLLIVLTGASPLPPESRSSALWFASLSAEDRLNVQADLVLTGDYPALVDGEFGPATYNALRRFQSKRGDYPNGVLSDGAVKALDTEANGVATKLGIDLVSDPRSGLAVFLPTKLLTRQEQSENGTTYRTDDGGLSFAAIGFPADGATLSDLRDALMSPQDGKTITYSSLSTNRLVVSGTFPNHKFYSLFSAAHGNLLGYNVNWTDQYAELGTIVAMFAASYSAPAADLPASGSDGTSPQSTAPPPFKAYESSGEHIGAFLLPVDDDKMIVLDGDITANSPLDYLRALKTRPSATTLLLNSDGGLVTPGLLIAHEVNTRSISTVVPEGYGCYSACAFIFFAGKSRRDLGLLGVHQIYGDNSTAETAQMSLSDILDALEDFDVSQEVISIMLRTPPEQVHIFSEKEVADLSINRVGDPAETTRPSEKSAEPSTKPQPQQSTTEEAVKAIDPATVAANQSLLLEASDDGTTGAVPLPGTLGWSKGMDENGQPTLIGRANIPARNLSVDVLIRKNSDPGLPASHLMEINFTVSDSFIGGSIAGLSGVLLKNEELAQGAPLVGASARVVGNSFLFTLSSAPEESIANVSLLQTGKWIDLAMIYATGKRAIITLEKDQNAQALFDEVFTSWARHAAEQAAANAAREAAETKADYAFAQFASMATKEEADVQRAAISVRYALQLGNHKLEVQKTDLGARGVRYRVYTKTSDLGEAAAICQSVIAAGGDCFAGSDENGLDLGL